MTWRRVRPAVAPRSGALPDGARQLVGGQVRPAVLDDLGLGGRGAGAEHDVGAGQTVEY
jgi:hypothetical protein